MHRLARIAQRDVTNRHVLLLLHAKRLAVSVILEHSVIFQLRLVALHALLELHQLRAPRYAPIAPVEHTLGWELLHAVIVDLENIRVLRSPQPVPTVPPEHTLVKARHLVLLVPPEKLQLTDPLYVLIV